MEYLLISMPGVVSLLTALVLHRRAARHKALMRERQTRLLIKAIRRGFRPAPTGHEVCVNADS
jgi:hypothetical protein